MSRLLHPVARHHLWVRQKVCNFATCLGLGVMKLLPSTNANVLFSLLCFRTRTTASESSSMQGNVSISKLKFSTGHSYLALITYGELHLLSSLNVDVDVTCKSFSSLNVVSDTACQFEQPMTVKAAKSNSRLTRQQKTRLNPRGDSDSAAAFGWQAIFDPRGSVIGFTLPIPSLVFLQTYRVSTY